MADTELDEILKDWEHIIKSVAMAEIYGVVNVGFSYNRQEAKQKLLKLIDKEVTRSRKKVWERVALETRANVCECGEKWADTDLGIMAEQQLLTIQEEGTDNG